MVNARSAPGRASTCSSTAPVPTDATPVDGVDDPSKDQTDQDTVVPEDTLEEMEEAGLAREASAYWGEAFVEEADCIDCIDRR